MWCGGLRPGLAWSQRAERSTRDAASAHIAWPGGLVACERRRLGGLIFPFEAPVAWFGHHWSVPQEQVLGAWQGRQLLSNRTPLCVCASPAPACTDVLQVLSTAGDSQLGGEDFTSAIAAWILGQQQQHGAYEHAASSTSGTSSSTAEASAAQRYAVLRTAEAAKLRLCRAALSTTGREDKPKAGKAASTPSGVAVYVPAASTSIRVPLPAAGGEAEGAEAVLDYKTFEELVRCGGTTSWPSWS